ncbi:universal stress protein UspA [Dokdonia pacifica]|uniref:Nucleotide-binding universal stress protein, UspA family n=1 Tax=Dokdonia pacifica TaxID=1627892 RepID=A0A239BI93_9FLAO|nr:universal stress protein [Dokdonia pacifica]GGG29521.1 universal stress protein UspA [Dokdonia pacifica]SNS07088.1 Nucleotide-binding universal stress protein, UspA family [Dokdonia pacifica]
MKHILIPTDFSENATNALHYAVQLMKNERCRFYLLNTYTPISLYTSTIYEYHTSLNVDLGELYRKTSEEKLQQSIKEVTETFSNKLHGFELISSCNLLTEQVIECVNTYDIDFIVMGTQGASGFKEIFLGSQTMHIIKKTTVPVICVPNTYTYRPIKDIVFATDYELSIANQGLPLIKNIATSHGSRVIFLNAYYGVSLDEYQLDIKEKLDSYFTGNAHQFHISDGMDVLEAVDDFQSKHNLDLLVMIHNKHNIFENLLFTPVINKIAHHTKTPFLVIPAIQKK